MPIFDITQSTSATAPVSRNCSAEPNQPDFVAGRFQQVFEHAILVVHHGH